MKLNARIDAGHRTEREFHFVIVSDEQGIFDAFKFVKDRLSSKSGTAFLSLIYAVSDKNHQPLFEKELSILEKRYSNELIIHFSSVDTTKHCVNQELLEAIINSNTVPKIKFLVFGHAEFVDGISEVLRFLDVKVNVINSK